MNKWTDRLMDRQVDIETNPYMSNVMETKDTEPKTKNNSVH